MQVQVLFPAPKRNPCNASLQGFLYCASKESDDTSTAQGQLMMMISAGPNEFERKTLQRQAEDIILVKAQGKYKGRKRITIDRVAFQEQYTEWKSGKKIARAVKSVLGMKLNTFYMM